MKRIKYIIVIAALGLMPMSLHAMSLHYSFSGSPGGSIANTRMFSDSGVDLTVTAQKIEDGTSVEGPAFISQNLSGIGGCSVKELTDFNCNTAEDSTELDSSGDDEVLSFAVAGASSGLLLNSFTFMYYDTNNDQHDNFIFTVDGVALNGGVAFHASADNPWVVAVDFGEVVAYSSFSIRAISTPTSPSSFRILEMNATKLPEPGTLGMLVFGLAAVGFIR